ncbi:toxin [Salmonella enterica]|nr:toxin [Salmonella enterica]EJU7759162.1 toxin [Salmonella enterica subsp. enterica serovar 11:b:1,7]EBR4368522.1 toxin [Salmonella enterica]EHN6185124.1 toxin [Salmonella enterica]EJM4589599.1 toxin [Salmonella enterica]
MTTSINNLTAKLSEDYGIDSLAEIACMSFETFREQVRDELSWSETRQLYLQAVQEKQQNILYESQILARSNPQLQRAVGLGIQEMSADTRGYEEFFGNRAQSFVNSGSVASMFSPAGYLTELYREAKELHAADSVYHLDSRRPDLASLALSQDNMDKEVSTLSLSNEILRTLAENDSSTGSAGLFTTLSTFRQNVNTPYHHAYESVRQSILLQDPTLSLMSKSPDVTKLISKQTLMAIESNISPELYNILIEDITQENAEEIYTRNFGDIDKELFFNPQYVRKFYNLTQDEINFFMGSVLSENSESIPGVSQYKNNQCIFNSQIDNSITSKRFTCSFQGSLDFKYADLVPLGAERYRLSLEVKNEFANQKHTQLKLNNVKFLFNNSNYPIKKNHHYNFEFSLSASETSRPFNLYFLRYVGGQWRHSIVRYVIEDYSPLVLVLKLNKAIRLYKATGLSPIALEDIVRSVNNEMNVTPTVLAQLFSVKYYMSRYNIGYREALVLAKSDIGLRNADGKNSHFNQLFNTPPLNSFDFSCDEAVIDLKMNEDATARHKAVLHRAFNTNDATLLQIAGIVNPDANGILTNNITNLSCFYRVVLMARVHDVTIPEFVMLWKILGLNTRALVDMPVTELSGIMDKLYAINHWLREKSIGVADLFAMTTVTYNTVLTPEIQNFIDGLKNSISVSTTDAALLINLMSSQVMASLQLASMDDAITVLKWINQTRPGGMDISAFWNQVKSSPPNKLSIQFCHALAQLALICRTVSLPAPTFALLVDSPAKLTPLVTGQSVLGRDIMTLIGMSQLSACANRAGDQAATLLSALHTGTLTTPLLAQCLQLDESQLVMANNQALDHRQVASLNTYTSWADIDVTLQWYSLSDAFRISPQSLSRMLALDFSATVPATYTDWQNVADALSAGLKPDLSKQLNRRLDESLGGALSGYVIGEVLPSETMVETRDDLYQYLLIDNQVSPDVTTTLLAEAIASVQLYIHRALNATEPHTVSSIISRQFFKEWDKYNKNYSTWAGVSQLAYYPENYVDPSLRIGQTGMMNTLQQTLNQNTLSNDSVEAAFQTYLTTFEKVANLKVISAYHDNVNTSSGLTYFVGCSGTEDNEYYWRSVDQSKFNNGKFSANAWSEWKKIGCAMTPYRGIMRPVIYKSRLYILWLERKEISKPQSPDSTTLVTSYQFDLKLSHIQYDGNWSAPLAINVNKQLKSIASEYLDSVFPALYAASFLNEDTLQVMIYTKAAAASDSIVSGLYIYSDMTTKEMTAAQTAEIKLKIGNQLDTTTAVRVNNRYAVDYEIPSQVTSPSSSSLDALQINRVKGEFTSGVTYQAASSDLKLYIKPKLTISYETTDTSRTLQLYLMKRYGVAGKQFIFYNLVSKEFTRPELDGNWSLVAEKTSTSVYRAFFINLLWSRGTDITFHTNEDSLTATADLTLRDQIIPLNNSQAEDIFNSSKHVRVVNKYSNNSFVKAGIVNSTIQNEKVKITVNLGKGASNPIYLASTHCTAANRPAASNLTSMGYQFNQLELDCNDLVFNSRGRANVEITFTAQDAGGRELGSERYIIPVTKRIVADTNVLTLHSDSNGAQFLKKGPFRVRLNTTFARQLTERATTGIDTILTMATQRLPEPMMGLGFYVRFGIPRYNEATHGTNPNFSLWLTYVGDSTRRVLYQGKLDDVETNVTLFIPVENTRTISGTDAWVYMTTQKLSQANWDGPHFTVTKDDTSGQISNVSIDSRSILTRFNGIEILLDQKSEPMDFSGANSLYFWELFYYTPTLVALRLLQEQNFEEANRWLKYVWNPAGYTEGGIIQFYKWNVRPLEEDTVWDATPLDSTDPDAIAQADPMHYKVSTFMQMLDLLMARGDYAYRKLERDSLNEAKMWYMQALNLLGEEPEVRLNTQWTSPRLNDAASATRPVGTALVLSALRAGDTQKLQGRTANSLVTLFLPQQNEKLAGYWQTLRQRMHNLRHHLSLDGQPLHLPVYSQPGDPKELLRNAALASQGSQALPEAFMPLYRFPRMLESARGMVSQLSQFGSSLMSIIERQDAEALNGLLQTQARDLMVASIAMQSKTVQELDTEKTVLNTQLQGAQKRLNHFRRLYDENISPGEIAAMTLKTTSSVINVASQPLLVAAAAIETVPNIFGFAVGGGRWGGPLNAIGLGMGIASQTLAIAADTTSQAESYRRRRQEWEIQRDSADTEVKQINAQLSALVVRREAAVMQKNYLETQQSQLWAQADFMQRKFSTATLYSWLRGKLSEVYFRFYDLAVSRCLMAEMAFRWETNVSGTSFIKPGAWQSASAGLLCGEALMLNLAQMEDAYIRQEKRALEVERTVSLAQTYQGLSGNKAFNLVAKLGEFLKNGSGNTGDAGNGLTLGAGKLSATIRLSDLNIAADYPDSITGTGKVRRIKSISVSLPALLGPYQDIQALLSYGGSIVMPEGCNVLAVSRGMNDSGQFLLDFNDGKFLPFEGIPVTDTGTLTLAFPNATLKQKALLESLSDIILHIRYTIR